MTAMVQIVRRTELKAVLVRHAGIGYRVGVGDVASGTFTGDSEVFTDQRRADAAAIALADRLDLLAVRD